VAPGGTNFGLAVARAGLQAGIVPHTLSTDASTGALARTAQKGLARPTSPAVKDPGFSLLAIMSKFIGLGLGLEQVVEMTTITPARILGEEKRRGSLQVGMQADVTLLRIYEGEVVFPECTSDLQFTGNMLLVADTTLKAHGETVEIISSN
jgi:dihydroorotase